MIHIPERLTNDTVLWLGPDPGWEVMPVPAHYRVEEKLEARHFWKLRPAFIISYRYRHLVPQEICEEWDGRAFNVHMSMLPHNRGADPNLWSWIDKTPRGLSIHCMSPEIDMGDIVYQYEVTYPGEGHTLRSYYQLLDQAVFFCVRRAFLFLLMKDFDRTKQERDSGSFHRLSDRPELPRGWDTPVLELS